jgi:uncharacterized membrane protein
MKFKKAKEKTTINILYFFSITILLVMIINAFNKGIWTDEAFSLTIIKNSYYEIIKQTANDVHPPLYYFILKFFVDILLKLNTSLNEIIIGKLISIVPYIILLILAITKIRNNFGSVCSAIFAICIVSMPNMLEYSIEIRMYSWSMLFVTTSYLYCFDVIKNNSHLSWFTFTLFSLLSAYTHLYACIAIVFIYLFLFIWMIFNNRIGLKNYIFYALLAVLLYMPWILIIFSQFGKVSEHFWIPKITLETFVTYIKFAFFPQTHSQIFNYLLGCLTIILSLSVIFIMFIKNKSIYNSFALSGFLVLVGLLCTGILVSLYIKPLFISRYMFPALGCFWFCFSYFLSRLKTTKIFYSTVFFLFILGITNSISFSSVESQRQENYEIFEFVLNKINKEDIIIFNYSPIKDCVYYYKENECYLLKDFNSILNFLTSQNNSRAVWLIESYEEQQISNILNDNNLNSFFLGKYSFDLYNFDMYKIVKK